MSGQELSITGLSPGTYCFVSTADPAGRLIERDDGDNWQSIALSLGDGKGNGTLDTVTKQSPGC